MNSNSRTSNCQCSEFSKKNPITRIFCLSGCLAFPINPDNWSSTVPQLFSKGKTERKINFEDFVADDRMITNLSTRDTGWTETELILRWIQ